MADARLLMDEPLAGPVNMGRDEALLQRAAADAAPVLRFYAWSPPTISLGYFQEYAEFESLESPASELDCVRRTTGGGAILHDLELTYSITIGVEHPLVRRRPNRLYELAHEAVVAAIGCGVHMLGTDNTACDSSSHRGPFFCFARRHGLDVVIPDAAGPNGYAKIAGSAQRRTHTAILQHGSIMLDCRYPQQPIETWSQLAGRTIDFDEAARRLLPEFSRVLGYGFVEGRWTDEELSAAEGYIKRYAGEAWTLHRER